MTTTIEYSNNDYRLLYGNTVEWILKNHKINEGICLDIGTGPGYIGIELAKRSNLSISYIDINPVAIKQAEVNVKKLGLEKRSSFYTADVARLPFSNQSVDLVVSRGSIWFWENLLNGLKEIYRVMRSGAVAVLGGGFGSHFMPEDVRERIIRDRRQQFKRMREEGNDILSEIKIFKENIESKLSLAGISTYKLIADDPGVWLEIKKN
ncbi:class I SAM-dependent methyltransferase [Halocella sp. SP3-1]|uniref:class I SAM-dependent methyltransferase n=1 Tax=Halocella sp. SP3-1 TaxID=2382161 RepID=UPI000F75111C|nr:class I SAM-dependent methyltransferase [Halocella sp. SP3-1]AZO96004.1 class I SAM-dependent methyltransferase [Halocella sp. SP3-1]